MRKFKELSLSQKIIRIIILVFVVCLIIVAGVLYFLDRTVFATAYEPDIVISSPDGKYELVAREWGYAFTGGMHFFFRKAGQDKWYNSWLEKEVGRMSAEECSNFSAGFYDIEWGDDTVTIYFPEEKDDELDRSTWQGEISYEFG